MIPKFVCYRYSQTRHFLLISKIDRDATNKTDKLNEIEIYSSFDAENRDKR